MDSATLAITLVLVSAFMHAGWNSVVKAGEDRLLSLAMVDGTAFLLCLMALPLVQVPEPTVWLYVAISVVLNTIYRLFLIKAYEAGDFGQVYPVVRGVPPVLVALLSTVFLGEYLTLGALAGVILVSAGIIGLTVVRNMTVAMITPIAMAVCAGLFIAAYTVVDAKGVRESASPLQYIVYLTLFQSIPIPLLALLKDYSGFARQVRSRWPVGAMGGAFYLASYGIVLYAFSVLAVAKVSALRETSVVIAAVIGAVFFREGFGAKRIASAVVILTGIALIKMST